MTRRCALCGEVRQESRLERVEEWAWICRWRAGCDHRVAKLEATLRALAGMLQDVARLDAS